MGRDQFSGKYRDRQVALGKQIFKLMDIAREDKVKRLAWTQVGFRFFDAPAVIIICMDKALSPASMYDIGAIAQTIALAALPHGLGTCIQGQRIMYPDVVRKHAGIPDSKLVITCLTIGYPDEEAIVNQVVSERKPVEKLTVFRGFWLLSIIFIVKNKSWSYLCQRGIEQGDKVLVDSPRGSFQHEAELFPDIRNDLNSSSFHL